MTIWFTDWGSSYDLRGSDKALLFALRARIEAFSDRHKIWFGGRGFQFLLLLVIVCVSFVFLQATLTAPRDKAITLALLGLIGIVAAFVLLVGGYLDSWFPQTAIYSDSASFIERNAALIGFWGLIATIIAPLISGLVNRARKRS